MKIRALILLTMAVSGCATLQSPKDTNIAVSALLNEIQIAINEIAEKTPEGSSLPPFKSAEVKLNTKASETSSGSAALVLSGDKSKTRTDSNTLTLELVPNPNTIAPLVEGPGHSMANYVISAVSAVDENSFLKLKNLTVEAGLSVIEKMGGGIEVELIGITVKGGKASESTNTNSLKLLFSHPEPKKE